MTESPVRTSKRDFVELPLAARVFTIAAVATGAALFLIRPPDVARQPAVFIALLAVSLLTAVFKIVLPLSRGNATMTLGYAPDFACLMLLGANEAMLIGSASAWCQCAVHTRERWPGYRTLFSMASIAVSIQVVGLVFAQIGGQAIDAPFGAVVAAMTAAAMTYFVINTGLVAVAIALSAGVSIPRLWHQDLLWSAPSYFLCAGVALSAVLAIRVGAYWAVPLAAAPLYLTYRSYKIYLDRLQAEQRHAQELAAEKAQLAIERERLAVTLSNIGDGVITTDARANIVLLNRAAEEFIGLAQGRAAGLPLIDAIGKVAASHRPSFARAIEHVLARGVRVQLAERPTLTEARGAPTIECSGSPIRNADGTIAGAVWVFRDVSSMLRLEQERSKADRLASLGVLAGGLAHDFNNILTGVVGNISLARLDTADDTELATRLADAERACHRARGITSQLLTFSKGGAPVKTPASIHHLVEETATFALSGSKVAPVFNLPPGLWPADVDVGQLSQVISNLVINARQAMPFGGTVRIQMENVEVAVDEVREGVGIRAGRYVAIAIADCGMGIATEHLGRIFDPYFSTKKKGAGLGLTTSYSIVNAHRGYITVESTVGKGTRFVTYLPAAARVVAAPPSRRVAPTAARGGRALIMDDEATILDIARGICAKLGYEAVTSRHGAEAVERFSEAVREGRPFDVVIMDLTVPGGMGGQEALVYLKAIDPAVKAIVASGYTDDAVMADFEQWGFCAVMAKPFNVEEFHYALERAAAAPGAISA
jgi:PAS domain S-box-containing protein